MSKGNSKTEVIEITCPQCERRWPRIAEQGVVTAKLDQCYSCFIAEVVAERDLLAGEAGYEITNCGGCNSQAGLREKCLVCFNKGWVTVNKPATH